MLPLPHNPKLPVDLFMLLSGFLMAARHSQFVKHQVGWCRKCLRFWITRFFRIAPAYYVTLAFVFVFNAEFRGGYKLLWQLPQGLSS